MVYHATLRRFWSFSRSGFKFFMTTAVLGISATIASALTTSMLVPSASVAGSSVRGLCWVLGFTILIKLAGELSVLTHLRDKQQSELKRSALLLRGELSAWLERRVTAGLLGGVLLPWAVALSLRYGVGRWDVAIAFVALFVTLAGELFERLLFFSAVSAPKMPGGLR
jgi:DMSO reductase anchor subunit